MATQSSTSSIVTCVFIQMSFSSIKTWVAGPKEGRDDHPSRREGNHGAEENRQEREEKEFQGEGDLFHLYSSWIFLINFLSPPKKTMSMLSHRDPMTSSEEDAEEIAQLIAEYMKMHPRPQPTSVEVSITTATPSSPRSAARIPTSYAEFLRTPGPPLSRQYAVDPYMLQRRVISNKRKSRQTRRKSKSRMKKSSRRKSSSRR